MLVKWSPCFTDSVMTGDHCDEDFDGCADSPCFVGTNCTDLVPSDEVQFNRTYNCSDCPSGYEEDEGTCSGESGLYPRTSPD